MKKFYKWYWQKSKNKEGLELVWLLVWAPTVVFFFYCTLLLIGSVGQTSVKYDDFALAGFVISGLFLATISFWEGFPKPPKR
jgi:hypothetical protein